MIKTCLPNLLKVAYKYCWKKFVFKGRFRILFFIMSKKGKQNHLNCEKEKILIVYKGCKGKKKGIIYITRKTKKIVVYAAVAD